MRFPTLRFAAALACLACFAFFARAATAPRAIPPGSLIVNEDNSHFFGSRDATQMTPAGLNAWVDQYAGTRVTHLFLNPTAMRASFRSQTREAIWDPVNGREPDQLWPQNAKRLHQAGLDPYTIWIARARERGLSPWISMRMNDVHSVDVPDNFMHAAFWREHPELRRVPGGALLPWTNQALNYAHAEVRAYEMAHLRELFARYDADGFELDWMRFPYHLTPGHERAEAPILDAFMREVRELADTWEKKRGHKIHLGVRVTVHPDAALGLGLDAVQWAKAGWVDLIVPCPFWRTSDFDIPVELWQQRLGPARERVAVIPGFEHNLRPWITGTTIPNDLAALRGWAAAMQARGADGLYLFNWMDSQTRPVSAEGYAELVREGLSADAIARLPQRLPITFHDTVPDGFPDGTQLPVALKQGGVFRLRPGPPPPRATVSIVIAIASSAKDAPLSEKPTRPAPQVRFNGHALSTPQPVTDLRPLAGGQRAWKWTCPLTAVRAGENEVVVDADPAAPPTEQVVWVEFQVTP